MSAPAAQQTVSSSATPVCKASVWSHWCSTVQQSIAKHAVHYHTATHYHTHKHAHAPMGAQSYLGAVCALQASVVLLHFLQLALQTVKLRLPLRDTTGNTCAAIRALVRITTGNTRAAIRAGSLGNSLYQKP